MTDREKMIELVYGAHNAVTDKAIENHSTFGMSYSEQIETEANFLIANGVKIPVLCKDCIQWHRHCGIKDSPNGHCFTHDIEMNGFDFCSYGERKNNEN